MHLIWLGIVAPAGTPADIIARLNKELAVAWSQTAVRERLETIWLPAAEGLSTHDFEVLLKADFATSQKIVSHLKLKAD